MSSTRLTIILLSLTVSLEILILDFPERGTRSLSECLKIARYDTTKKS